MNLSLRPIHYASVSGGKDSLYMLNLILNNPEKYPLDMVVHFEMDMDWDWVKNVINFMEQRCNSAGLKFVRIKSRLSWEDQYKKYGFPNRKVRWCSNHIKRDCKNQINEWIKSLNCRPIAYIGFCADEVQRFKYHIDQDWHFQQECYPLALEGIKEEYILQWAKKVNIFNDWYKLFSRQGCALCPFLSMKEKAYMFKYYRDLYDKYFTYIKETEDRFCFYYFGEPLQSHKDRIEHKWLSILEDELKFEQMSLFDFSC